MDHRSSSSQDDITVDEGILALRDAHQRIMFSDLAHALPSHTWHALFSALGRLSRQEYLELIVHQWDYEVVFLPLTSSRRHACAQPRHSGEQDEHYQA